MDDGLFVAGGGSRELAHREVFALAARALSVVAARKKARRLSHDDWIDELCQAFIHPAEEPRHAAVSMLIANGVSSETIIDEYIPLTARRLGEGWVNDTLSFAQVSIGGARLQETVRALRRRSGGVAATVPLGRAAGRKILMAIPCREDHTLGAFVAASQFRRQGFSVHMAIGQEAEEIGETAMASDFDLIGISGAGRRALAPIVKIVERIRQSCSPLPPIVVGGTVCNLELDVCAWTGADFATTSPKRALALCGKKGDVARETVKGDVI